MEWDVSTVWPVAQQSYRYIYIEGHLFIHGSAKQVAGWPTVILLSVHLCCKNMLGQENVTTKTIEWYEVAVCMEQNQ